MSVSQYLSGGSRKWFSYFLFRLSPPFILLILLAGILNRYMPGQPATVYVVIAAIVSLLFRDLSQILKADLISEKLLHTANTVLVLFISFCVASLASITDLSLIAPSISGLVDNLWSSLLVALLVLAYLKATNMSRKYEDKTAEETAISNYVVRSYAEIKKKYGDVIDTACRKNMCSKQVLYAILIYENMNRPHWLRAIENGIVRILKKELTVGIAQVRSNKPLTNAESIQKAAKILVGSVYADAGYGDGFANISQLEGVLDAYNSSEQYTQSISKIMSKLRTYACELFEGETK